MADTIAALAARLRNDIDAGDAALVLIEGALREAIAIGRARFAAELHDVALAAYGAASDTADPQLALRRMEHATTLYAVVASLTLRREP